jgi:hypothetical protein
MRSSGQFFVAMRLPSLNDRAHNAGNARWSYAKLRDDWRLLIRVAWKRDAPTLSKAIGKRNLLVRREYKGREQERDYVNLVGGCKAVVDALVLEGLLVDDSPALLADRYEQVRVPKDAPSGVWFEIEEVA